MREQCEKFKLVSGPWTHIAHLESRIHWHQSDSRESRGLFQRAEGTTLYVPYVLGNALLKPSMRHSGYKA